MTGDMLTYTLFEDYGGDTAVKTTSTGYGPAYTASTLLTGKEHFKVSRLFYEAANVCMTVS